MNAKLILVTMSPVVISHRRNPGQNAPANGPRITPQRGTLYYDLGLVERP